MVSFKTILAYLVLILAFSAVYTNAQCCPSGTVNAICPAGSCFSASFGCISSCSGTCPAACSFSCPPATPCFNVFTDVCVSGPCPTCVSTGGGTFCDSNGCNFFIPCPTPCPPATPCFSSTGCVAAVSNCGTSCCLTTTANPLSLPPIPGIIITPASSTDNFNVVCDCGTLTLPSLVAACTTACPCTACAPTCSPCPCTTPPTTCTPTFVTATTCNGAAATSLCGFLTLTSCSCSCGTCTSG